MLNRRGPRMELLSSVYSDIFCIFVYIEDDFGSGFGTDVQTELLVCVFITSPGRI